MRARERETGRERLREIGRESLRERERERGKIEMNAVHHFLLNLEIKECQVWKGEKGRERARVRERECDQK